MTTPENETLAQRYDLSQDDLDQLTAGKVVVGAVLALELYDPATDETQVSYVEQFGQSWVRSLGISRVVLKMVDSHAECQ